jgi:hypothetical protein
MTGYTGPLHSALKICRTLHFIPPPFSLGIVCRVQRRAEGIMGTYAVDIAHAPTYCLVVKNVCKTSVRERMDV